MLFFPTAILEGSQLLQSSPITVLGASLPPYSNSEPPPTPPKKTILESPRPSHTNAEGLKAPLPHTHRF